MRNKAITTLALAATLAAAGQAGAEPDVQPITLVEVDGFPVTNLHLALFGNQTGRSPAEADAQLALLNELVNNFMVANSPEGRALADRPEVVAALEVARARLVAQTFVRSQLEQIEIDEAQLREAYDLRYGDVDRREYKARHILVDSEGAARAVIAELDDGGDFATLAGERSIGPSKTVGGDLGWFEPEQMAPAFSAATIALGDGEYSKDPVQTRFGWHVVLREQSRAAPAPAFEAVRDELETGIKQQRIAAVIDRIRANTRIEVREFD